MKWHFGAPIKINEGGRQLHRPRASLRRHKKRFDRNYSAKDQTKPRLNPASSSRAASCDVCSGRSGSLISAVIVTYDSATCIGRCIASVQDTLPAAKIIVVDNASQDETLRVIRGTVPRAQVIESGENIGFGRACNLGAKAADRSHLLFLNPDTVITAVNHERLDELLGSHPFGLAAPVLESEPDRRREDDGWLREYFAHTFEALRPREWQRSGRRYRGIQNAWVSGAMLLVAREEFLEMGGFDPRFFLYYEDRDLSRRYNGADLPVRTTEALRGRHAVGSSSATDDVRAAPMAWSLLGWIQYIYIHDGERNAGRAARVTITTLRFLRATMRTLGAFGWGRARRKAWQLDEVLRLVAAHASGDAMGFCPEALPLVRGLA